MTNEEIRAKVKPAGFCRSNGVSYDTPIQVDNLMNEARADERSKVIGEIETWVLGEKRPVDNYILAKLNEMKNVPIQKT